MGGVSWAATEVSAACSRHARALARAAIPAPGLAELQERRKQRRPAHKRPPPDLESLSPRARSFHGWGFFLGRCFRERGFPACWTAGEGPGTDAPLSLISHGGEAPTWTLSVPFPCYFHRLVSETALHSCSHLKGPLWVSTIQLSWPDPEARQRHPGQEPATFSSLPPTWTVLCSRTFILSSYTRRTHQALGSPGLSAPYSLGCVTAPLGIRAGRVSQQPAAQYRLQVPGLVSSRKPSVSADPDPACLYGCCFSAVAEAVVVAGAQWARAPLHSGASARVLALRALCRRCP